MLEESPEGESKLRISGTDIPGGENGAPLVALWWELAQRSPEQQGGSWRRREEAGKWGGGGGWHTLLPGSQDSVILLRS